MAQEHEGRGCAEVRRAPADRRAGLFGRGAGPVRGDLRGRGGRGGRVPGGAAPRERGPGLRSAGRRVADDPRRLGVARVKSGRGARRLPLLALLARVHRLVGQPVRVLVLLARDPLVDHLGGREDTGGLGRQRLHVRVLDLPAARHLLDDELGVHADPDRGRRIQRLRGLQPGDQALVLGDVVGRHADVLRRLRQRLPRPGVDHRRAVPRRTRIPPGAAVRLDDELPHYRPDSDVRTRIRRQFSQRSTVSGEAALTSFTSVMFSSNWQPSQRRW